MTRSRAVGILVLGGLVSLTSAAWIPAPLTESQLAHRNATEWAQANRASLPVDYHAFIAYSLPYRRAIYKELEWSVRGRLWREQLETYLTPAESLSTGQRAMVADLGAPLTPNEQAVLRFALDSVFPVAYDPALTIEQRQALAAPLCERASSVLGAQRTERIFWHLGPRDTAYQNQVRTEVEGRPKAAGLSLIGVTDAIRSGLTKAGLYRPSANCWCRVSSACDCADGFYCVNSNCEPWFGCGCGGFFGCNGNQCSSPT